MLKRLDQVDDACKASWLSLMCATAPDANTDPELPVRMAESLVMRNPGDPISLGISGAALFRAGQLREAVARLDAVIRSPDNFVALETALGSAGRTTLAELRRQGFKLTIDPECAVSSRFYLAMAHKRLGHAELATTLIKDAIHRMGRDSMLDPNKESPIKFTWSQGLQLLLLRREAEELLQKKEAFIPSALLHRR
jgi:hypothetical protein